MARGVHFTPAELAALAPRSAPAIAAKRQTRETLVRQSEARLQAECEEWLRHRGYVPRTPKTLADGTPAKGWYIHMAQPEGNPILLDLLILDIFGAYFEIELKVPGGSLRRDQHHILNQSMAAGVVWSLAEFVEAVQNWESGK